MIPIASTGSNNKAKKTLRTRSGLPPLLSKRLGYISTIFIIFMFSAYNVILIPGYYNYEYIKYGAFKGILLLSLLAMLIVSIIYRIKEPKWPLKTVYDYIKNIQSWEWALIIYLFIGLISSLASLSPLYAFKGSSLRNEGFLMLLCYGTTFFMISRSCQPNRREFYIFAIVCAILALYGIGQYFDIDPLNITLSTYTYKYHISFYATLSNTNAASALLTLCLMISSILFIQGKDDKKSWIFLICVLTIWMVICLGETESGLVGIIGSFAILFPIIVKDRSTIMRGCLLFGGFAFLRWVYASIYTLIVRSAITLAPSNKTLSDMLFNPFLWISIALFIAAMVFYLRRKKNIIKISDRAWHRVWWIGMILCMVLGIVLLPKIAAYTQSVTINEFVDIMQGEIRPEMGSNRAYIWDRALKIYGDYPILGVGPDMFYNHFEMEYGMQARELYGVTFDKTHSEYLQTLVDMGPIALGALLAFYGILLKKAWKYKKDPMVLAVMGALICFLIQAIFNFSQPISTPVVWTIWGVLGALVWNKKRQQAKL